MNNQPPSNQSPDLFEFIDLLDSESLTEQTIELSDQQIDRAAQLSQPIPYPNRQWQTYLHGLALLGFEQWLDEWASDLKVDESNCSIFQPPYANLIDAVCHLQVGHFDLCLIATPLVLGSTIEIPKAIIDLSQFVPHVYVLLEVQEEQMQVQLYGYLRHDQLIEYSQSSPLATDTSWVYAIPLHWFNADPSKLLIELRRRDAESLLSTVSWQPIQTEQSLQTRLHSLLPQLRSPDCSLSQILTWEEAAMLLSNPELVRWIYQVQKEEANLPLSLSPSLSLSLSSAKDLNSQPINVGHWLTDRLDEVAHRLGWILLPPLASASALRSAQEELEILGVQLPPEARGAYEDLQLGNVNLRLHAFAWILSSTIDRVQWTLLIVLGAQPPTHFPAGIRLQIRDQAQLLFEQVVEESAKDTYLYAQVGGDLSDRFWVTINLPDGATIALPPFVFNPDLESE
jgi:hypothetical protein